MQQIVQLAQWLHKQGFFVSQLQFTNERSTLVCLSRN